MRVRSGVAPCDATPVNGWTGADIDFGGKEGVAGGGMPMPTLLSPVSRRFITTSGSSPARSRFSVGADCDGIGWPFARAMSRAKTAGIAS